MSKRPTELARNKSNVGAASELTIGADLLLKGWHVFRSQSPTSPCDFLIMNKEGKIFRVEVRTGHLGRNGKVYVSDHGHYDVLAVVVKDTNSIEYRWGTLEKDTFSSAPRLRAEKA